MVCSIIYVRVIWCGVCVRMIDNEETLAHWGPLRHKVRYGHSHPMLRCVILTTGRTGRVLKLCRNVSRWDICSALSLFVVNFKCLQVSSSTVVVVV